LRALSLVLWFAWRGAVRSRRAVRRLMFAAFASFGPGVVLLERGSIANARRDPRAVRVGAGSVIGGELLVFGHGGTIEVGEWCFVGEGTRIWSAERVTIGNRVLISHGVNIHDNDAHPRDPVERHAQFRSIARDGHPAALDAIAARPVTICDDVWIGFNATILKGVTIGPRSIIAAGSIVTRDVPCDSLFIGGAVAGPAT
jgi:acetyltransferase-like isoleucine patch superfamily enzyme